MTKPKTKPKLKPFKRVMWAVTSPTGEVHINQVYEDKKWATAGAGIFNRYTKNANDYRCVTRVIVTIRPLAGRGKK